MNESQLKVLGFGVTMFVLSCVYIPWTSSYPAVARDALNPTNVIGTNTQLVTTTSSYSLLWSPPEYQASRPDMERLLVEWLILAAVFPYWMYCLRPVKAA